MNSHFKFVPFLIFIRIFTMMTNIRKVKLNGRQHWSIKYLWSGIEQLFPNFAKIKIINAKTVAIAVETQKSKEKTKFDFLSLAFSSDYLASKWS